ncbi:phosphodiesterase [Calidifontibacter sp. DB0510]|uniref:Phosphodiesterase n=2 Tax=Metallococcus carri TaxID=1656884 RepID=A0A967B422_9MICO|nr:DUF5998 family protein [Metallococcus carri]NHN56890.1 phosphodiesterase [Metallococcus carri]NOP37635.1 phosphodiesterase [Calidifontibacter sp. DB2511S]
MSPTRSVASAGLPRDLIADIEKAGYYPLLVADVVAAGLADQTLRAHLVHAETTLDGEHVRRHITVLGLTDTRLIIAHADDHTPSMDDPGPVGGSVATATTESIPLRGVRGVMLVHVVADPESYRAGQLGREITLTIGWGAVSRVDLLPAACADPSCEADHGYEGTVTGDDLTLRISADADGDQILHRAQAFAAALSAAIGH